MRLDGSGVMTQLSAIESRLGHSAQSPLEVDFTLSDFLGAGSLPLRLLIVA
jgi:hypothetical protein